MGKVAATFLADHDTAREACRIATRDGVTLGSIFLVRATNELAKPRLLRVEPAAQ